MNFWVNNRIHLLLLHRLKISSVVNDVIDKEHNLYYSLGFTEQAEESQKAEEEEEEMAPAELQTAVSLEGPVSNDETSTVQEGSLI